MHDRGVCPVLEMNVGPIEPHDSPPTHSGVASPRSLCKVKKVVQQEMKQKLHLITAPLLSVTEEADNRMAGAAVWDLGHSLFSRLSRGRFKKHIH